jgi:hypothetical protein
VTFFVQEEIVESCSASMGMNTNNLGFSSTSTRQLERMIDDAAWLTYPVHLLADLIKTFVYTFLFIGLLIFMFFMWMFTAHDQRAELTKDFITQESVFRVDPLNNAVTEYRTPVDQGIFTQHPDPKEVFSRDNAFIKNPSWFDHQWLAEKSDVFETAYIRASYNLDALRMKVYREKGEATGWPAGYYPKSVVIPNAPVVYMSFLEHTDEELRSPANAHHNWYTGICLVSANCTDADFLPRNTSIFYDAIAPEMTPNQSAAVKALYATGTPEFWIAAAHANGIINMDADFANAARDNKTGLDHDLKYDEPPTTVFVRGVSFGVGCYAAFVVLLCACFTRQRARCLSEKCRPNRAFLESATLQ